VPSEAELDAYDRLDPAIEIPPMVEVAEDIEVVEEKEEEEEIEEVEEVEEDIGDLGVGIECGLLTRNWI
jgi:hypothetical protein